MSSLFFWNEWSRPYRLIYLVILSCLFLTGVGFIVAWLGGVGNVVRWDVLSELIELPATIRQFTDGLLDYPITGNLYVVSEQFIASAMQLHPGVALGVCVALSIAFTLLLGAITTLPRTAYLGAMSLFLVTLAVARFDSLVLPGLPGQRSFIALTLLFGMTSYYIHAFRADLSLPLRLGIFGLLIGVVALGISWLAQVPHPALTVVSYALPALVVLSIGFITFIAFEPVAGLVWLTSRKTANGQALGLRSFLFITALYLINIIFIWLKNSRTIHWDIIVISPFILYLLSVSLGIWGFRRMLIQQDKLDFTTTGVWLYTGLALLCTATIGYAFATANDPLIEVFEDTIVFSHFAMGVVFTAYIVVNFSPIFRQNLPIHRVLYKTRVMVALPLFRLAGLVVMVGMLGSSNYIALKQSIAGYYNGLGDLYTTDGDAETARTYYQLSLTQEYQQHKANYALAWLALGRNDQPTAGFHFQQALLKQPSPQAYSGLSSAYAQTNLFFEAVKALQRGIAAFPRSGELRNNLGYLYAKTSIADSAYYYFSSAANQANQAAVPKANLLALYARNPAVLAADSSLTKALTESDYESYQANALAVQILLKKDSVTLAQQPVWLSKPITQGLSVGRFASVYNYALTIANADTALTNKLQRLANSPANQDFIDDLLLARAFAEYNRHNPAETFALLEQLANGDERTGDAFRRTTGLLMLEQGLYKPAAELFALNTDTLSAYYQALSYTKTGDLALAIPLWEKAAKNDPTVSALYAVLYDQKKPVTDLERAFYVQYRTDDPNRGRIWETITDPSLRTVSGVALLNNYLATRQPFYAAMILSQMGDPAKLTPVARSLENLSALRLAVFRNKPKAADTLARQPIVPQHRADLLLLLGQVHERNGQLEQAAHWYTQASKLAPLQADVVAATAQFWRRQKQTKRAYQLVLAALPYNPKNPELLKNYINLCLDQGLRDYAAESLSQLQAVTTSADYQAFAATYQQRVAFFEKSREKFLQ